MKNPGASHSDGTHQPKGAASSKQAEAGSKKPSDAASKSADGKHPAQKASLGQTETKSESGKKAGKGTKEQAAKKPDNPAPVAKFPGAIVLSGKKSTTPVGGKKPTKAATTVGMQAAVNATAQHESASAGETTSAAKAQKTKTSIQARKAKDKKGHPAALLDASQLLSPGLPQAIPNAPVQVAAAANAPQPNHSNIAAGHTPHASAETQTAAVTVIDLRHSNSDSSANTGGNPGENHSQDSTAAKVFQLADGSSTNVTRLDSQAGTARATGAPAQGQSFQALTDQIVKQTSILLKDNNAGEIRLVLKPEHLGNMRIKIDMNNNNLTGKIVVQNHDALRLVQQNLDSLYRALRDSGFTATQLNVSVGGKDAGARDRERSSPLPSARAIQGVRGFDSQTPGASVEANADYYSLVNLVI